jgi:hypothetical protein
LKLRFPVKGDYHVVLEAVDRLGTGVASAEMAISWRGLGSGPEKPKNKIKEILGIESDE